MQRILNIVVALASLVTFLELRSAGHSPERATAYIAAVITIWIFLCSLFKTNDSERLELEDMQNARVALLRLACWSAVSASAGCGLAAMLIPSSGKVQGQLEIEKLRTTEKYPITERCGSTQRH